MTSPLTMTRADREAFLADLHVGVLAVVPVAGGAPLAAPVLDAAAREIGEDAVGETLKFELAGSDESDQRVLRTSEGVRERAPENIAKSYVSRIVRLALLSPDIIEAILAGRTNQGMILEQLERPLPASWEEQRDQLC